MLGKLVYSSLLGTYLEHWVHVGLFPVGWDKPLVKRGLNSKVKTFASSGAHSFGMLPGIPSGPVALSTFIPCRILRTPAFDTLMWGMGCLRLGSSSRGLGGSGSRIL